MSPRAITDLARFLLLSDPSFLLSYLCRCELILAAIWWRTSGEVGGLIEGKGGKQLIVMLAQMESYLHPRFAFGGMAG